jgi:hypothetical protein
MAGFYPNTGTDEYTPSTKFILGSPGYNTEQNRLNNLRRIKEAGVAGTAQGTGAGNAATSYLDALKKEGLNLLGGSSGTGSMLGAGGFTPPPTVSLGGSGSPTASWGGFGSFGGGSAGGSSGTSTGAAGIPNITPVDTSAAQQSAFARAKDQVGQETSGALTGLRSALGGRGMLGSGSEARGTALVANRGQGELGQVSRDQAMESAKLAQQTAETNYQGGITQRGQSLESQQAANALAGEMARTGYQGQITQRGQDISLQESAADRAWQQAQLQRQATQGLLDALGGGSIRY